jgi:hypothetical protein
VLRMESNKNILCSLLVKRINKERGRQIKTIEKLWIVYLEGVQWYHFYINKYLS